MEVGIISTLDLVAVEEALQVRMRAQVQEPERRAKVTTAVHMLVFTPPVEVEALEGLDNSETHLTIKLVMVEQELQQP